MANALMAVVNPIRANAALNPKLQSNPFYSPRSLTVPRAHKKTELRQQNAAKNPWTAELKKFQKLALIAGANVAAVMPAMAMEKAALFDFNLTLPIIAAEFLILMVALDKIWFAPLGKFMDERDEMIRQKLMSVKDNSEEIKQLQEEGEAMLKAARAEVTAALNKMKKEMSAELEQKLQESRKRVEKELAVALEKLEAQRQETLRSLDQQIDDVSQQIVQKVLPFKV